MSQATDVLPIGTMVSGFTKGKLGPFRCDNCIHADWNERGMHCEHPLVQGDLAVTHNQYSEAVIEESDCCTYFRSTPSKTKS